MGGTEIRNMIQLEAKELWAWALAGLRASVFLNPHLEQRSLATPLRVLFLSVVTIGLNLTLACIARWSQSTLDAQAWLTSWWHVGFYIFVLWFISHYTQSRSVGEASALTLPPHHSSLANWYVLLSFATVPVYFLHSLYEAAQDFHAVAIQSALLGLGLSDEQINWILFLLYWLLVGLEVGTVCVVLYRQTGSRWAMSTYAVFFAALLLLSIQYFSGMRIWIPMDKPSSAQPERLVLSQAVFEGQQKILQRALEAVPHRRPERINVYAASFAPYAAEKVFTNEVRMVDEVVQKTFRSTSNIQLVNHATTAHQLAWATPDNLEKVVANFAQKMNLQKDILLLYMTSHGAKNGMLAANHWPLTVDTLLPAHIDEYLKKYKIQNAVLIVSACYSGSWIAPLQNEYRLILTAADADHTSYGCGSKSELTFFGRALFDEALRQTPSFEQAFAVAVPVIKQREIDAKKDDGFSNPQISMGERIRPILQQLELQLLKEKP